MPSDQAGGGNGAVIHSTRILHGLSVGVMVVDRNLQITYANDNAAALLGITPQEVIARHVADPRWLVCHPDGTPVSLEEFPAAVALRTREPVLNRILGITRPDGVGWLALDATPLFTTNGEVDVVVVTLSEVTRELNARMQVNEVGEAVGARARERDLALASAIRALDTSEARHRAVLRAMSEGVVVHSADGSIQFANPAAQQVLGLTMDQLQNKRPIDSTWALTDGDDNPLPPDLIPSELTRVTGEPQRQTLVGVHRGSGRGHAWLLVSTDPVSPVRDPDSGGYPVVSTFTDVTAERAALADARAARDHLRDIAAALPGVVLEHSVTSSGKMEIRYISEPAREYLGIAPEGALFDDTRAWVNVSPEDRELLLEQLCKAEPGRGLQLEFRVSTPNGTLRHLRLRSGPPTKVGGGLLYRSVILDVTEQRRLEETVREAQRREAIGTLAAGMAHNFNNMLAVIVPSIELAQAQAAPALARELEDALTATRAATELVRQLLQLVRRDVADTSSAVDVGALLEEVCNLCRRTFDTAIDIQFGKPSSPCVVLARRNELQQALLNLCINARDALVARPTPRLTLRVTHEVEHVLIEVRDNGEGMTPEVQRRLGEPFFTTKPPGRGTGLGLATVYGIVADLRGTLHCFSTSGRGTRFEMRLPKYHANSGKDAAPKSVNPSVGGIKVLLVDDEDLVRNTLKRVLVRANANVLCASRALQGMELLKANPDVKLVLLDIAMPELNGIDMLRLLRQSHPSLPVYFMTGYLPEGADVSQANGVLLKPVELNRLRELLVQFA